jgi:hypothetical protein
MLPERILQVVHREAERVLDLACREAGGGFESGVIEEEVAVVVGEAETRTVVAGDAPAPGERGGAGGEVGLEGGRERLHGEIVSGEMVSLARSERRTWGDEREVEVSARRQ